MHRFYANVQSHLYVELYDLVRYKGTRANENELFNGGYKCDTGPSLHSAETWLLNVVPRHWFPDRLSCTTNNEDAATRFVVGNQEMRYT